VDRDLRRGKACEHLLALEIAGAQVGGSRGLAHLVRAPGKTSALRRLLPEDRPGGAALQRRGHRGSAHPHLLVHSRVRPGKKSWGLRICGNGIISSFGETEHSLTGHTKKVPFNPDVTGATPYDIWHFQDTLFVIDSFGALAEAFDAWVYRHSLEESELPPMAMD